MTSYLVFYGFNIFQLHNLSRIQIKIIHVMGELEYSHMHGHWMLVHKHIVQKNSFCWCHLLLSWI